MDIEKLMGVEVETADGEILGEIIGIELYGPKVSLISSGEFVFTGGGPDDDDGEPVPVPEFDGQTDGFVGNEPLMTSNVVNLFGGHRDAVSHNEEA